MFYINTLHRWYCQYGKKETLKMSNEKKNEDHRKEEEKAAEEMFKRVRLFSG